MIKQILLVSTLTLTPLVSTLTFAEQTKPEQTKLEQTEVVVLYVNINTDSAEKLADLLTGVGKAKAQAIVDYRTKNGEFKSLEDLLNVPGIGPATVEKNKQAIRLSTAG